MRQALSMLALIACTLRVADARCTAFEDLLGEDLFDEDTCVCE